jgi:hypothetical protein
MKEDRFHGMIPHARMYLCIFAAARRKFWYILRYTVPTVFRFVSQNIT